jgi:hypothetical protein
MIVHTLNCAERRRGQLVSISLVERGGAQQVIDVAGRLTWR